MIGVFENDDPFDFDGEYGAGYEALARAVIPGYSDLFDLVAALLVARLGTRARVLVVGAGTGIEVVTFKRAAPAWRLTGVDPARQMLDIAARRTADAGVEDGVRFHHGYVSDLPTGERYDAATVINVLHFVADDGRKAALLEDVALRLKPGASLVLFDLHGDPATEEFARSFAAWREYWRVHGLSDEERAAFEARLDAGIRWVSEPRIRELLAGAGFERIEPFARGLLYGGWVATRGRDAPSP